MTQGRLITITVSREVADAFEAHAHQLAPARIVRKDPKPYSLCWTYTLNWPDAPEQAATVTPLWCASHQGDFTTLRLHALEWYDTHGRLIPGPDPADLASHAAAH